MNKSNITYLRLFTNKRILITAFLAFSSGLPFSLTGSTLQAWLAKSGINIETIGLFGLVGIPYVFKFIWAPIMDRFVPPFLDRRRGWIVILQALLAIGLLAIALCDPERNIKLLSMIAFGVAFFSASQDIVIDAYRADLLPAAERGIGAAVTVGAYRIAIIVSGAFALAIAYYTNWHFTYFIMAALMFTCIGFTIWGPSCEQVSAPLTMRQALLEPFREFLSRDKAILLILLIMVYKLSDAIASSLVTAFLLRGVGFSLVQVAAMNKVLGIVSNIAGAFVGGAILARISLVSGLMWFGVLQMLSNLMFWWLAIAGKVYILFAGTVFAENFCGGLGTAAYFSLLMALCHKRYSATQYALFSALFALTRVLISPLSGEWVAHWGWANFFMLSVVAGLPALFLVYALRKPISRYNPR